MAERTFYGDPNPPPRAPEVRPGAAAVAPPPEPEETEVSTTVPAEAVQGPKSVFRVSQDGEGRQRVYRMDDTLETTDLGPVSVDNAADVLGQVGSFNDVTGNWTVPEEAALKLLGGELPLPAYVQAKYEAGKAELTRSLIGLQFTRGEATVEDAQTRGNLALLQAQTQDAPLFAWQGGLGKTVAKLWADLREAGAQRTAKRALGETAQLVPAMVEVGSGALKGAAAGAALGAAVSNPAAVVAFAELGGGLGVFTRSADLETGSTAMDMLDKGFDEKTAKRMAPIAGAFKGLLEVVGFKYLTAPLKRAFVSKVLTAGPVRAALVNYAKETGGEISTEVAQTLIDTVTTEVAARLEEKPELADSPEGIINDIGNTILTAGAGMGLLHAPGIALDVAGAKKQAAEQKAATDVLATVAEERKTEAEAEASKPAAPAAENLAGATPERVAGVSPTEGAPAETFDDLAKGFEEAETPEDVQRLFAAMDAEITEEAPTAAKRPAVPAEEKVQEVERKGVLAERESKLEGVQARINALENVLKESVAKLGPTRALTEELRAALVEKTQIKQDIEFYTQQAAEKVTAGERLHLSPATLDSVMKLGFAEGKKESKVRAQEVLAIAKANGLTQADVRTLLRNKAPGAMGDAAFRNFMEGYDRTDEETGEVTHVPGFRERVVRLLERKAARADLRVVQKDRQIRQEQNVRALHSLPPVAKMSTEQLTQYAKILSEYDKGDIALSPKRVSALETAPLAGFKSVKTVQDVLRRAAAAINAPLSAFRGVMANRLTLAIYDTPLARKHPFFNFMVHYIKALQSRSDEIKVGVKRQFYASAAKAFASRPQGVAGRAAPTMPEIMAYVEEADEKKRAALWEALTPEEQAYVLLRQEFFRSAWSYLVKTDPNLTSRYVDDRYVPHVPKRAAEIIKGISDKGLRASVGELVDQMFPSDAEDFFSMPRQAAQELGLRKFLKQTVFRSGKLDPSRNVLRADIEYIDAFYNKVALDTAIPVIDSIVLGMQVMDKSPDAVDLYDGITKFTRAYLNAKKGKAELWFQKGDLGDRFLRAGMALMSLKHIAANVALQLTAPVGEQTMEVMHLGARGYAKAKARKYVALGAGLFGVSTKAAEVLEKYKHFTGESPVEMFQHPGRDIVENVKMAAFGMFQFVRKSVMEDVLLGNMTDEEFAAGEISHERLAAIKVEAGRWLDVHGAKSVIGSTTEGATWTQFKGWAIPPATSILSDAKDLLASLPKEGKPLTIEHWRDFYRLAYLTTAAFMVREALAADEDGEDDSLLGQVKARIRREVFSMFSAVNLKMFASAGVFADWLAKFARWVEMTVLLEKYDEEGPRAGEFKGPPAWWRLVTPAVVKQLQSKDEEE